MFILADTSYIKPWFYKTKSMQQVTVAGPVAMAPAHQAASTGLKYIFLKVKKISLSSTFSRNVKQRLRNILTGAKLVTITTDLPERMSVTSS